MRGRTASSPVLSASLAAALFLGGAPAAAQEMRDLTLSGALERGEVAALDGGVSAAPRTAAAIDVGTAARLSGAGILGGAIGFFGGAYLGALMSSDSGFDDLSALRGMMIGATAGEALLLPAGVHLANGRRGSYWTSALVSLGIAAGGVGLMEAAHWDPPAVPIIAVAVPVAQLVTSIAIERAGD